MTHERDMTTWDEIGCQRGCVEHPTRVVNIQLGGPTKYRDLTPIPNRFAMNFDIEVWDTTITPVDGGPYCPARDAVSETIISHGVWEPRETTILMLAWEALGRVTFIDVGAQVGWFSVIARESAVDRFVAVEADPACCAVLRSNGVPVVEHRIGTGRVPVLGDADSPIVMKVDVEGAEAAALDEFSGPVDARRVPFILMEVSPCFNDSYPELVTSLMDRGYHAYNMPPKQVPPVKIDQLADLLPYRLQGDFGEVWDEVASWHQEDLLLVLGGVGEWV